MPVDGVIGLPEKRVINITDSDVVLQCRVRGRPAPQIQWYKDDAIITSESDFFEVVMDEDVIDYISKVMTSTLRFRGKLSQLDPGNILWRYLKYHENLEEMFL